MRKQRRVPARLAAVALLAGVLAAVSVPGQAATGGSARAGSVAGRPEFGWPGLGSMEIGRRAVAATPVRGGAGLGRSEPANLRIVRGAATRRPVLVRPGPGRAGVRRAAALPAGWGATGIESAYRLPGASGTGGTGQTVAIVSFLDTPTLAGDLAVYRKTYGLPACATCLRKVGQTGAASPLPPPDPGFAVEATTDADMITAACPHCTILLVEAGDTSDASFFAAADTAARLGAQVIMTGFGNREYAGQAADAVHFNHPGHAIVVAAGDEGFTAGMFPAVLSTVTAVGGTTLSRANNARGWKETAWGLGGSGCSAYVNKPAWQRDPHCPGRTVADVAAVAQNLAVYDSYTEGGWLEADGTSAAAAIVAGVYGLAGNAAHTTPAYPYAHRTHLYDVTSGTNDLLNGAKCGHDYLCTAKPGYDAPTGLGTPDGPGAF